MLTPLFTALLSLGVAFVTTFAFVPQVRRFAIECRVADKPNGRKLHAHAIPHLGGIAIFFGVFLGLLISLAARDGADLVGRVLALLPGLVIVFGLGLVDDLRGLRAGVKLTYQILAAACVVAMGAGFFRATAAPGALGFALLVGLSLFWYVGVCNSVNLIDGLDGLAAGTATLAAAGFLGMGLRLGDAAVSLVSLCLIGSLLAFLRFNFHPARIFMGDTGSMFIGFALASLACLLSRHLGLWTACLGGATILGLPLLDTASAICRRLLARRHIFQADGEHTHHKLMRAGLSHRGAVVALYGLEAVFVLLGCGVMLGYGWCFAVAVALGVASALAVTALARRAQLAPPAPMSLEPALAAAARRLPPTPSAEPVPLRAVPVASAAGAGDEPAVAALQSTTLRPSGVRSQTSR